MNNRLITPPLSLYPVSSWYSTYYELITERVPFEGTFRVFLLHIKLYLNNNKKDNQLCF